VAVFSKVLIQAIAAELPRMTADTPALAVRWALNGNAALTVVSRGTTFMAKQIADGGTAAGSSPAAAPALIIQRLHAAFSCRGDAVSVLGKRSSCEPVSDRNFVHARVRSAAGKAWLTLPDSHGNGRLAVRRPPRS